MNNTIISIVKNSSKNENDVSCIKCARHSQFPEDNKQTGVNVIGVIVALIQIIHSVLNMFDQTKFQTHISNFFFTIAVMVVANSGKLVQAAIIVAQMARCDIQKCSAINTAESTTVSDAKTKSHKLAINLAVLSSINLDHSFLRSTNDNIKKITSIHINIALNVHNQKDISNAQFSESICIIESITVQTKRYTKFFISGSDISISSSVGASFFIHKYPLYHISNASSTIPHRLGTELFRSIQKINAVTVNKNTQSL